MALIDLDERRFDEALAKLTQAIEAQRKLLAVSPKDATAKNFLANHLTNQIRAAEGLGRADLAADAKRELDLLLDSNPRANLPTRESQPRPRRRAGRNRSRPKGPHTRRPGTINNQQRTFSPAVAP
jgi:hypothetical protein